MERLVPRKVFNPFLGVETVSPSGIPQNGANQGKSGVGSAYFFEHAALYRGGEKRKPRGTRAVKK